ncbi:MAG: outer membrane lipoprotein-sorting protein [Myxococcaceae bacterium]
MAHRNKLWRSTGALMAAALCLAFAPSAHAALTPAELADLIKLLDDRQRNFGDYKALVYLEQKEKDKRDTVREALVYRRDGDDKLLILFTKPKTEQGKGYLRLEKNLWSYDPTVGKWERRTERERIAGTDSRRADFDESRIAEEYDAAWDADEKLGKFDVSRLILKAKSGVDVAYPMVKLWVDKVDKNILKRQEFALSGRLMRTLYYPRWERVFSESKKGDVWTPKEIRIYDEVEKANSTIVLMQSLDLRKLEANIFTKAWLEAKSR